MSEYICPSCKSESIQRLSVIYEGGISNVRSMSSGVGTAYNGMGAPVNVRTSTSTSGVAQTAASRRAAPPSKKHTVLWVFVIFMGASAVFALASIFLLIISTIGQGAEKNFSIMEGFLFLVFVAIATWLSVLWVKHAKHYNETIYPPLKQKWDRSYQCNRCGNIFELA